MPFAVNRDPEGFFILRSRQKEERSVRATKYFVRASGLAAPFPPVSGLQLPQRWVEGGRRAILVQGIDRFRKSPPPPRPRRSAGTFSSTLYSSVARTERTLVTKVTRPPALLPSGHHWQQELPQPFPSGSCWPVGPSLLLLPPGLAPPGAPTQPRWLGPGLRGAQEGRSSRALPVSLLFFLPFLASVSEVPRHDICPLAQAPSGELAASHRPFSSHTEEMKLWCKKVLKGSSLYEKKSPRFSCRGAAFAPWKWEKTQDGTSLLQTFC